MRFLWVEDFGEDSEDQEDKQELWETYFSIKDNILLYSLEDALKFLDNFENRRRFDVVLLDIRFPVLSEEGEMDEEELYHTYFSSFITKEIFDKYASFEVMKDASSGILLFLALIFRYGYHWDTIAFISANIDNEDLSAITELKELMTKQKYNRALSARDITIYKTKYLEMFSEEDNYGIRKLEMPDSGNMLSFEELVSLTDAEAITAEIKKLNTIQEMLNENISIDNRKGLKYCSVRSQFRQIGLRMPPAFEKPTDERRKTCWLFKEWIDAKADGVTLVKRSILNICELLLERELGDINAFLNSQRKYHDGNSAMTQDTIMQYLRNIRRNAANCPDIKTVDNETAYAADIAEAVVSLWESVNKPHVNSGQKNTYYDFAYYSVMKLTRNWMAHQGIKGIDIRFAAFVFVIAVRGIFHTGNMSAGIQKKLQEEIKKLIEIVGTHPVRYQELKVKELMKQEYNRLYHIVKKAIPPQPYKGKMRLPATTDPFALISALGHEDSCMRDSVSVNEIYKVFWLTVYFGDGNSAALDPAENEDKILISILENTFFYQK